MKGLRLGLSLTGGGSGVLNPATLFTGSDAGIIWDGTSSARLFQSSAGSGAVDYGSPVGYVSDLGPSAKPALQATSALRPLFSGMPKTLGSEAATNGRFTADANWTKGAGWTIGSGVATAAAGSASNLSQAVTLVAGQAYVLTYNITRTAGSVTPQLTGGTTVSGLARSAAGSYHDILIAATGNTTLAFAKDATFAGSVDNVSLKPISAFGTRGLRFDGADDVLQSAAVNMSAGTKLTVVLSAYYSQDTAIRAALEVGNALSGTTGSVAIENLSSPWAQLRGATGLAENTFGGGPQTGEGRLLVSTWELDPSAGTIADQIKHRLAGLAQTGTTGGSSAGGGNIVNGAITLGSVANGFRFWKDLIHRVIIINRALTTQEKADAENWVREGMAYCAVLGDSTVGFNSPGAGVPYAPSIASLVPGLVPGEADKATVGDKIADQKTKWTAITDKSNLEAVLIQVGLNDCNAYSGGSGTKTVAQITADLQDLVDTVNTDKPAGCRVYICTMTPAKAWLGTFPGSVPATAYALWQGINDNIAGTGANPITGVDGRITGHTAALDDGSGNLQSIYDYNADGVHESAEARLVIAGYWRSALEAGGLVA